MTQMQVARAGKITDEMKQVAETERMDAELLRERIARGELVIPKNKKHDITPIGIGKGLRTKVNANIGTSSDFIDVDFDGCITGRFDLTGPSTGRFFDRWDGGSGSCSSRPRG